MNDLPPIEPSMRGRAQRPAENRAVLNGILWRLRCDSRIERMFGHLKINRAARYHHRAESFLGMIHIAATRYLLPFVHAA